MVFICSFLSSIPDFLAASGSEGSSNFPGGGLPGPLDFKAKLDHILHKDTDVLADFMTSGVSCEDRGIWDASRHLIHNGLTIKQLGLLGDICPLSGSNIAFESNVFKFITNNGHIQLDVNAKITWSMIDSVKALKLNVPR